LKACKIELANTADAQRMADLHQLCFSKSWPVREFASLLHLPSSLGLVAAKDGLDIGFVLIRVVVDEAEILTLGVAPEYRGFGAGHLLLEKAESMGRARGVGRVFLEVSVNNKAACDLYSRANYSGIGIRQNYYSDGSDACVMEKSLLQHGQNPA
jgi:ribosomal-protein-alanine N-acetyltransferase